MDLALSWPDCVLTVANVVLLVSMVPVFKRNPVIPLQTSVPTMAALSLFSVGLLGAGLVSAGVSSGMHAFLWGSLVISHPVLNKRTKRKRRK